MTNRTHTGILILVLAAGVAGCDGAVAPPTAPSTQPEKTPRLMHSGSDTHYVADVTLSGVVYELTPAGRVPIKGVRLYSSESEPPSGATDITVSVATDINGLFSVRPVWVCPCSWAPSVDAGITSIYWVKDGYEDPAGQPESILYPGGRSSGAGGRDVKINGDTQFDIQLVRR